MNNRYRKRLTVVESHNNASEITDAIQGYKVELVFMDSDDAIAFVRRATNHKVITGKNNFPITCVINKRRDNSQQTLQIVGMDIDSQSDNDLQQQFV